MVGIKNFNELRADISPERRDAAQRILDAIEKSPPINAVTVEFNIDNQHRLDELFVLLREYDAVVISTSQGEYVLSKSDAFEKLDR